MPTQNPNNGYFICKFCGKEHKILPLAVTCEESHDFLYVPLSRPMINRMLNFIYLKDDDLLSDEIGQSLIKTLQKYNKNATKSN